MVTANWRGCEGTLAISSVVSRIELRVSLRANCTESVGRLSLSLRYGKPLTQLGYVSSAGHFRPQPAQLLMPGWFGGAYNSCPQPALPEVPGRGVTPMAGRPRSRAVAGAVLSRRVHAAER